MVQELYLVSNKLLTLQDEAIQLLKELIAIPSFSREENQTADAIQSFLQKKNIPTQRKMNNVWCVNKCYNPALPTILLNSHHDTVNPNAGYTMNPFEAKEEDGKLYGLGSNDAGASLVSLLATFIHFYDATDLKYNLIFAATAEEEVSGSNGIVSIVDELGALSFAIVGEPTQMQLAISQKGLMVLDCECGGIAGHAANDEGSNVIYNVLPDLEWFKMYQFPKVSSTLGPVRMTVTQISAGTQHNVIPDVCKLTVDVRTTDAYTNEEVLDIIKSNVKSKVVARSTRLKPAGIAVNHPVVKAGLALGLSTYGSSTLSDSALLSIPALKLGPGDTLRSHAPDEFIYTAEIRNGIQLYITILKTIIQ